MFSQGKATYIDSGTTGVTSFIYFVSVSTITGLLLELQIYLEAIHTASLQIQGRIIACGLFEPAAME